MSERLWNEWGMPAKTNLSCDIFGAVHMDKLVKLLSEVLNADPKTINDSSSSKTVPGWDSFAYLTIITEIEDRFGIKFTTNEVLEMKTVGDIRKVLETKRVDK